MKSEVFDAETVSEQAVRGRVVGRCCRCEFQILRANCRLPAKHALHHCGSRALVPRAANVFAAIAVIRCSRRSWMHCRRGNRGSRFLAVPVSRSKARLQFRILNSDAGRSLAEPHQFDAVVCDGSNFGYRHEQLGTFSIVQSLAAFAPIVMHGPNRGKSQKPAT